MKEASPLLSHQQITQEILGIAQNIVGASISEHQPFMEVIPAHPHSTLVAVSPFQQQPRFACLFPYTTI